MPITRDSVFVERVFNCTPDKLFSWLTRADKIVQWFWPNQFKALRAVSDLKINGNYGVELQKPDGSTFSIEGRYQEIEINKKIVYTYRYIGFNAEQPESTVSINLEALAGNKTKLRLVQKFDEGGHINENREVVWNAMFSSLHKILNAD